MLRKNHSTITNIISALALSAFLLGMLACTESGAGGGGGNAPSMKEFNDAVSKAETLVRTTTVASSSADVLVGEYWTPSQESIDALLAALAEANQIRGATRMNTPQSTIDSAKEKLKAAIKAFEDLRRGGTKPAPAADKTELRRAIDTAREEKKGVVAAASADMVAEGVWFVPPVYMNALNNALGWAEYLNQKTDVVEADIIPRLENLNKAIEDFKDVKQQGANKGLEPVDTSMLEELLESARAARDRFLTGTSASGVPEGEQFVFPAVKEALDAAIRAAETAAESADSTQADIDAAVTTLNDAVNEFNSAPKQTGTMTDKDALTAKITAAESVMSGIFVDVSADNVPAGRLFVTPAVMDALNAAIGTAQAAVRNQTATQAQINAQITALDQAITVFNNAPKQTGTNTGVEANKSALEEAVDEAESAMRGVVSAQSGVDIDPDKYWATEDAIKALEDVVKTAEAVARKGNAAQSEVDEQTAALRNAIHEFTTYQKKAGVKVDKMDLESLIVEVETAAGYTQTAASADQVTEGVSFVTTQTKEALLRAIDAAKAVRDRTGPPVTQQEVDRAEAALETAYYEYNLAILWGTKTEKGVLQTVITSAESVRQQVTDGTIKIESSAAEVEEGVQFVSQTAVNKLDSAIAAAKGVESDSSAKQAKIDEQRELLDQAFAEFTAAVKQGTKTNKSALQDAIEAAQSAKIGIETGTDASQVANEVKFVSQAVMDALNNAIATAQGVYDNPTNQAAINAAVTELNGAVTVFINVPKQTGTSTTAANKTELQEKITAAHTARNAVNVVAVSADMVDYGVEFALQSAVDTLDIAIAAAEVIMSKGGATVQEVSGQVTALTNAVNNFNANGKGTGTMTNKTALLEAIRYAQDARDAMYGKIESSAAEVEDGVQFVTQTAVDALNAVITQALAVYNEGTSSQNSIDSQIPLLTAAVDNFDAAKGTGTKVDKRELSTKITEAQNALSSVGETAESAAEVEKGVWFVPPTVYNNLQNAITAATAMLNATVSSAEVTAQINALNTTIGAFNTAKKEGNKTDDPEPGTPVLLIHNQGTPVSGTSTAVPSPNSDGRLVFRNTNSSAEFPSTFTGVKDNTIVYLSEPMTGEFTFSARVKLTNQNNSNTTRNIGIVLGALSNPTAPVGDLRFVGIRMRTDGSKRYYRSRADDNSAATLNAALESVDRWDEECLLEVKRTNARYEFKLSDRNGNSTATVTNMNVNQLANTVAVGASVYPGFIIAGVDVEVSNISITAGGATVFSTSTTTASTWGVKSVSVSTANPVGVGDGYDYQSISSSFPSGGVQLIANVSPSNADNTSVTWAVPTGGEYVSSHTGGLVKLGTVSGTVDITVKATSNDNDSASGDFKFRITKEPPQVTSVTISGPTGLLVNQSITLEAKVEPGSLPQDVTWHIRSGPATISNSGVLTATAPGTVTVYAQSSQAGNNVSADYTVTILPAHTQTMAHWNFQNSSIKSEENYEDTTGTLQMLVGRADVLRPTDKVPTGSSGFSVGYLQPGGAGTWGTISQVHGPFTITLNYVTNADPGRYPSVVIGGKEYHGEGSTATNDPKTYSYTYTGNDVVDITLKNGSTNPGRIYDVIIKAPEDWSGGTGTGGGDTGGDTPVNLPIRIEFADQGNGMLDNGGFTLRQTSGSQAVQLSGTGWSNIEWYVDGESLNKDGATSVTIRGRDYGTGGHSLTVEATKNSIPWSKTVKFTVTNN